MTVFIILGCPRSGTSLVAGVLHESGVDMGARFVDGGHARNPHGFYEDVAIADHHAAILTGMGGNHLYPPPDGRLALVSPDILTEPLQARFGTTPGHWGWKDPRTILFWPAYRRVLTEWSAVWLIKLIITHRDLLSIARSWVANERLDDMDYALWLAAYYERKLADIALAGEFPILHVGFELWWHDLDGQIAQLEQFVGRELDFSLFDDSLWRH